MTDTMNLGSQTSLPTKKLKFHKPKIGTAIFLTVWSIYVLIPFVIMFNIATMTPHEALQPFAFGWDEGIHFKAFSELFVDMGMGFTIFGSFLNTLSYTIPPVFIGITVGTMAAYAQSKLTWHGRDFTFGYLMFCWLMPDCVGMGAGYMWFDFLGWTGTPLPFMIPGMFCGVAQVFFLKSFMSTIPNDLLAAAKVDGLGDVMVFWKIVFPLTLPAYWCQIIFAFIGSYNNYLGPLIYLEDPATYSLQLALRFFSVFNKDNKPAVMAGNILAVIPLLIVYLCFQDFILKGINMGSGLKL